MGHAWSLTINPRFVDAWHIVGRASRAAIPLGMMQDPELSGSVAEIRRSILSVPLEDWQREERRLLICFILINEIGISSSVLWPGSISMEDLVGSSAVPMDILTFIC